MSFKRTVLGELPPAERTAVRLKSDVNVVEVPCVMTFRSEVFVAQGTKERSRGAGNRDARLVS